MSPEDMISRLSGRLSSRRRIAIVAAMLGGLAMAVLVSLLWATEPALPARTRFAFAAIIVVGLAWAAYGIWVLTRRMPMFALDRVVAAWLGLAASGLVALPMAVSTSLRHRFEPAAILIVAALLVVACVNLIRARAHRAALLRRKRELGG